MITKSIKDLSAFGVFFLLWVFQNGFLSYVLQVEVDESNYPGTSAPFKYVVMSYSNALAIGNPPSYDFWVSI